MTDELSRRGFIELSGASALAGLSGGVMPQMDDGEGLPENVEGVGLLVGPAAKRPGREYFQQYDTYKFAYFSTDTGQKSYITHNLDGWRSMATEFTGPETQLNEVRTQRFQSFLNHTFARPNAPDDKNWQYTSAEVTKQTSEVELASTTLLESNQRGNYAPGSEAVPGVAWRTTGTPTAGRGDAGYFTASNGFGVGEDATDSYVFIRKAGSEHRVYRGEWNGHNPDARVWDSSSPVITRFPHLFYGGGAIECRAVIHDGEDTNLRVLHRFTPDTVPDSWSGPPTNQPNLPVAFESDSLSGGSVRANAAHYELGADESENRVNGEHFTGVSAGTTGWTPLLIWQKRPGWEMVNVKPLKFKVGATSADAKLALQLNPTLSNVTTRLPTNTSSDETAVEIVDASFDGVGERRWAGYAVSGQGNSTGASDSESLTFNLPVGQPVALVAQGVGGTANASGVVDWEEYF